MFRAGSNPACGLSKIQEGEDLWQWSRLETMLNAFCRSTMPQNNSIQFNDVILQITIVLNETQKFLYFWNQRINLTNLDGQWKLVKM